MAEVRYHLVFEGEIEDGFGQDYVRQVFELMFRDTAEKQGDWFSGQPVVLARHLDGATAQSFQQALSGAGAVTKLVDARELSSTENERRKSARRKQTQRRLRERTGSIVPDRRKATDRRN